MNEKVTVEFINKNNNSKTELEIPINITANELIIAVNEIFNLEMDIDNMFNCFLVAENPLAFLHGNNVLSKYGIRNGTKIIFARN